MHGLTAGGTGGEVGFICAGPMLETRAAEAARRREGGVGMKRHRSHFRTAHAAAASRIVANGYRR